jgi:hypothetical protein
MLSSAHREAMRRDWLETEMGISVVAIGLATNNRRVRARFTALKMTQRFSQASNTPWPNVRHVVAIHPSSRPILTAMKGNHAP